MFVIYSYFVIILSHFLVILVCVSSLVLPSSSDLVKRISFDVIIFSLRFFFVAENVETKLLTLSKLCDTHM